MNAAQGTLARVILDPPRSHPVVLSILMMFVSRFSQVSVILFYFFAATFGLTASNVFHFTGLRLKQGQSGRHSCVIEGRGR